MNLYDDDRFFSSYIALRNEANYNDLMETPAMLSLLGAVKGKRIIDLGCGFGQHSGYGFAVHVDDWNREHLTEAQYTRHAQP